MAHSAKGMQKALSHFRFNSSLDDTAKKQMFGHLVDSIRARVASDPLLALNELSDTYNAIVNRKLPLKVAKDPRIATLQENIVLHALQTMYKQNIERYLKDLHGKSEGEKKAAVEALERDHKKIINQKTGVSSVNIKQIINTLLQATSPRTIMPTQVNHSPSESGLKWQDDTLVKNNLIKTFVQTYYTHANNREKLANALAVKDGNYPSLDQSGVDQLDRKMEGMRKRMETLTEDPDAAIRQAATQALIDAGIKPKAEDKFLHQLLTGFRNPEKPKASAAPEYTPQEIAEYAHSLLAVMKPEDVFSQITTFYQQTTSPARKNKLLANAMILLHELILVDNAGEIFPNFSANESPDNEVSQQFNHLIQTIKNDTALDPERRKIVLGFEKTIRSASDLAARLREENAAQVNSLLLPSDKKSPKFDVNDFVANELSTGVTDKNKILQAAQIVAKDLKNIGLAHLASIKPTDFYGLAWSKESKMDKTHVIKFIHHCDKLSFLVINDLMHAKSNSHQEQIALFYANILSEAMKAYDYSTVAAVLGAFNHSSVHRLQHLKEIPEVASTLAKANELMSADKNFKNLRSEMDMHKNDISVPFIGMYLTDLTFANDKLPTLNSEGDLNVTKLDTLRNIFLELNHKFQLAKKHRGPGQSSNILNKINHDKKVDDKVQYERSLAFRAKTIHLSQTNTIPELLAKFPNNKVPVFLEITIVKKNKEEVLTNKRAYKAILKMIIEKAQEANIAEKADLSKLVSNISLVAQKNGLDSEKVVQLVQAAQIVTEVDEKVRGTLDFLGVVVEQYYQVLALKAALLSENPQTAKHLATKAEAMYDKLVKASNSKDVGIAQKAISALKLVDLMNSIPMLSEKYQSLKASLAAVKPNNLKADFTIHDQMDIIEEKLRMAAKHSDVRINIPAKVALAANQISDKPAVRFKRGKVPEKQTPVMLISQHRSKNPVVELAKAVEPPKSSLEALVLNNFLKDAMKAKTVLETFHDTPKLSENGLHSLQLMLKETKSNNAQLLTDPNFNISFKDYNKFAAISTLDYVSQSLKDSSSDATIERLIKETGKNWPEGRALLTKLKEDLAIEKSVKIKQNPRA